MKQKTIIAVYGTANVGKSMTLSSLGQQLVASTGSTKDDVNRNEYKAVINYKSCKVGVQTFGDLADLVQAGLDHFLNNNCEIIAIATKRYGETIDTVGAFAGKNAYRIIWATPYEIRDALTQTEAIKEYSASHLKLIIDDVVAGNI